MDCVSVDWPCDALQASFFIWHSDKVTLGERERRLPPLPPAASDQYRTLIMQAHIPSQLLMWEELVENAHPSSFCPVLSAWWL